MSSIIISLVAFFAIFNDVLYSQTPARCNYDSTCYDGHGRCQIARANPFMRAPVRSCQECLDLCTQYIKSQVGVFGNTAVNPLYSCQTVVFDQALGICDLYAVTGNKQQYPLIGATNRDLFTPRAFAGACNRGSPAPPTDSPIPAEATCPPGQSPRYLSIIDASLDSALEVESVSGLSREQCIQLCTNNRNPITNTILPCRSVSYSDGGQCLVSMDVLEPRGTGIIINEPGTEFLEKYCFPETLVRQCDDTFERWPQRTLVGFAEQVLTVRDFNECLSECLNSVSTFGFACSSGMYYYDEDDTNCILNSEDKNTQPDLFDLETESTVDYFETDCGVRQKFIMRNINQSPGVRFTLRPSSKSLSQRLQDDAPGRLNVWTRWSSCSVKTVQRYRYKTCERLDLRQCPSEQRNCTMYHIETNQCRCLLDSTGHKQCDKGLELVVNVEGKMEYKICDNPE